MRAFLVGLITFSLFAFGDRYPMTPDAGDTKGELCTTSDPDFREYRYPERIPYCERNVSSSLKKRIYEDYAIPQIERKDYTIDHLIPLSIGGDNRQINLWPEHKAVKALRLNLEYDLYLKLRDGKISQDDAIDEILWAKFHPKPQIQSSSASPDL